MEARQMTYGKAIDKVSQAVTVNSISGLGQDFSYIHRVGTTKI